MSWVSGFGRRAGRVAVLAWTVVVLVVAAFALSAGAALASAHAEQTSRLVRDLNRATRAVQTMLVDAEIGQQGFLLTGDETFLAPYLAAARELDGRLATLAEAARRVSEMSDEARALELLARAKLVELESTVTLEAEGRHDEALDQVAGGEGRRLMQRVRATVDVLLQTEVVDAESARAASLRGSALAAGATAMLGVLALVVLLQRHQRRLLEQQQRAERRASEALGRLELMSVQDPLTGLAHRRGAEAHLERALARAERDGTGVAVVLCDLDRFREINERHGAAAGDAVLQATADGLEPLVGPVDLLARVGADEFLLVVEQLASVAAADAIAASAVAGTAGTVTVDAEQVATTTSVGLVVVGLDEVTTAPTTTTPRLRAAEVMAAAEDATAAAKHAGGHRAHRWDPVHDVLRSERYRVSGDLRRALDTPGGGGLWVAYQPLVDLADAHVIGFEALVRWSHPERGPLPPGAFVPHVESSELVVALDRFVLRAACDEAARWNRQREPGGGPPLRLSVNCSPRDLAEPDLEAEVRRVLDDSGLAPTSLVLEITESAVVQGTREVAARLGRLVDLGVTIALDDFGSGYSSLSYLTSLPVSMVKVDRSLVQGLGTSAADEAVVAAISSLAARLGQTVLAEGIEERVQVDRALDLGCQLAQGFHFGRPVPPRDADALAALVPGAPGRTA